MIEPDGEVTYAVHGLDANGSHLDGLGDLASKTRFSIPPPGSCRSAACTAAEPGTYQVTGTIGLAGGTVTGKAVLHVVSPGRLVGLELDPTSAVIEPGGEVTYAVHGLGDQRKPLEELGDLAEQTVFSIKEPGSCTGATCTAATAGDYAVTGTIALGRRKVAGEATLHVRPGRATLALDPNAGPVGTKVTASGTGHGSCIDPRTHVGTVGLLWDQRREPIATATVQNADFTTSFEVPAEPGPHRVRSACLVDGAPSGGTLAAAAFGALVPTLVLDPVEGAAGSELVASGDEYPPACADSFVLQFDQVPLRPRMLERTSDPGKGWVRFRASADVPTTAGVGPHQVSVRCPVGEPAPTLATAPFGVTVPPTTPTVAPTTPTVAPTTPTSAPTTPTTPTVPPTTPTVPPTTPTVPPTTPTTPTVPPTTPTVAPTTGTSKPPAVPRQPRIASVTPGRTPAGTAVEVRGDTGSCNRAGTLTFHGPADVPFTVAAGQDGDFVTQIPIPTGTFPKAYGLELNVDCNGQAQRARATLTVVNHRPVAADDSAGTPQDTAVPIAVTANDTDPDGDGDYPTLVYEHSPPAHGTTETQPDGTMTYTPNPGFVGQDRFRYRNCDVLAPRNAAGRWRLACDTATVTVSTNRKCLAAATDVHQFQVAPARGARGAKLRITATVDHGLVACQLRFLLGSAPFGGDVPVGPDGGISQDRSVPGDATPGSSILRLATTGGQVLAGTPFEVTAAPPPQPKPEPWWRKNLYKLLAAGLAFLLGVSGRAAVRRWRERPWPWPVPEHVRVEPHPRPPRVTADQDPAGTPHPTIQLRPDAGAGIQTTIEVTG